jgi:hypothetical protein
LTSDPNPQVRRECALAINHNHTYEALDVWLQLAQQYPGNDRWSVEALSIGAIGQWERIFPAWLAKAGKNPGATNAGKDIIWLARTRQAIPYLTDLAADTSVTFKSRLRYFRAFDFFHAGYEKSQALMHVMNVKSSDRIEVSKLALLHLDKSFVTNSQQGLTALNKLLDETYGTEDYIELVTRYAPESENNRLFQMAINKSDGVLGRDAGALLLDIAGVSFITDKLATLSDAKKSALLASLQTAGSAESVYILRSVTLDVGQKESVRADAARYLGGSWPGEDAVVKLLKQNQIDGDIKEAALVGVKNAFRENVKAELAPYFPKPVEVVTVVEEVQPKEKSKKERRRRKKD